MICDTAPKRQHGNLHRLCATILLVAIFGQPAIAQTFVELGEGDMTIDSWLISDWPAGQSEIMRWSPQNVVQAEDGTVTLSLEPDPQSQGSSRTMYRGGEVQSVAVASTGTWTFDVQAPDMVDGAVFGLFLYRADWQNDPWREYDIEFVGSDTTQVQLNIHFQTEDGTRVSLDQARGGVVTVDLGFDASKSVNTYAIEVQPEHVVFRVNDRILGRFGPEDMPRNTWDPGMLKAFVDLWAAAPGQADWTGDWVYPGTPLTARIERLTLPEQARMISGD